MVEKHFRRCILSPPDNARYRADPIPLDAVTLGIDHTAMRTMILLASASLLCFAADTGRLKTEVDPGRAGVIIEGK